MTFIFMAGGVTFRHCACSGKTSITMGNASHDNGSSKSSDGCMTIATVSLSPTTQAHPMAFDFQVFQPLVAIIGNWDFLRLIPWQTESITCVLSHDAYSPPPRQYLHTIRVLII